MHGALFHNLGTVSSGGLVSVVSSGKLVANQCQSLGVVHLDNAAEEAILGI